MSFLLISVIIIIHFDCVIEISRDTLSVNAYAIGSEPITPYLVNVDTSAIVPENKMREILDGIYRTFKMLLIS